jgi:hypothetical protein
VQAEDGTKVEANWVYVIPPGKHLTSVDGHLQLTDLERPREETTAHRSSTTRLVARLVAEPDPNAGVTRTGF